jgi:hypothetical protein
LYGGGKNRFEYRPIEDGVADPDERHDDVLSEETGNVRGHLLPKVGEQVRYLKRERYIAQINFCTFHCGS